MRPITTLEELQQCYLDWRGIEHPCKECGGSGIRAYSGTSTWRGGVGGMAITSGVCDKCWGSGDAYITWPSRRKTEAQDAKIATLTTERDKLKEEKESIRSATIEECARVAERPAWSAPTANGEWALREAAKVIAAEIRSLNSKQTPPPSQKE